MRKEYEIEECNEGGFGAENRSDIREHLQLRSFALHIPTRVRTSF